MGDMRGPPPRASVAHVMRRLAVALCFFLGPQLSACSGVSNGKHAPADGEQTVSQTAPLSLSAGGAITNAADTLRTGWYPDQAALAPDIVGGGTFTQAFSTPVDGQVYAQPLVSGGTVFVVTESNHVYALDAGTGAVQASRALDGTPFNPQDVQCGDLLPTVGVTGTPVIDASTSTAYFFAKTYASGSTGPAVWNAHAVDVLSLQERPGFPVLVQGTASNDPAATFDGTVQHQRPGLLLMNGVVYAGFGAHCDHGAYRGWIAGVTTAGQLAALWTDEAGGAQAGIWQGNGGLVSDGPGEILFATGNGDIPAAPAPGGQPPGTLGEAVVRLTVQSGGVLAATDFFMPKDAPALNSQDTDLGSGGSVGLPDSFGTTKVPHLLVQEGKSGYLYLLNRDTLGGYMQAPGGDDAVVQRLGPDPVNGQWGRPGVWPGDGGYVYLVVKNGPMRVYTRGTDAANNPLLSLAASSTDDFGYTSGSVVVTSNGTTSGSALAWVVWSSGAAGTSAQLRAYDAVPVGGAPTLRFSAPIGQATKFEIPGIAGGRVYVGTGDGHVLGFGSPASAPLQSGPLDFGAVVVGQSKAQAITLTAQTQVTVSALSASDGEYAVASTTPALPATLAQGDTLTANVAFSPATPGAHPATLAASTSVGTQTFPMSGSGLAQQALLVASAASIDLGSTSVGHPVTTTVTLTNQGAQTLTFSGVTAPAAPFSAGGLPAAGATLAAGQSITATITFAPTTLGPSSGSLSLASDGGSVSVALSGTCLAPGHLVVAPATASAGKVAVGANGLAAFTITNTGPSRATVTKSKPPTNAAFTVVSDVPESTAIDPGASVTAVVEFTPGAVGLVQDQWVLNADDDVGLRDVPVQGEGVAGVPSPAAGGWTLNGSAALSGSTLVVTPATNGAVGSAFWPTPVASDGLDVQFDAAIDTGSGADGLTLTLANPAAGAAATSLGAGGGGLGFSGIAGVAVALDTFQNAVNPSANFVGVSDGPASSADQLHWLATATNVPALRGAPHHVRVTVSQGALAVAVDGLTVITTNVALPSNVLVGFTGGCGGLNDRHAVSDVSIAAAAAVPPGKWQLNGTAVTTSTGFQLTDTTGGAHGSVFWTQAIPSSAITASFDASIGGGSGADGLALVFADPSAGATVLGTGGGGLGFSGIHGVAVALDTYKNSVNPSANFLGVSDGPASAADLLHWLATSASAPALRGTSHHVVATLQAGNLAVTIDGAASVAGTVTLPANVLVGFTGANGGLTDRHAVDNVHVSGIQ
jgi:hypothetical protein